MPFSEIPNFLAFFFFLILQVNGNFAFAGSVNLDYRLTILTLARIPPEKLMETAGFIYKEKKKKQNRIVEFVIVAVGQKL